MLSFSGVSNAYYQIDDIPDNNLTSITTIKPKRNLFKRFILILVIGIFCIVVLTIIMMKIIPILKRKSLDSSNYKNSSLNKNKFILNIPKPFKSNTSLNYCQIPTKPIYKKNGTIVAGVLASSTDELNKLNGPTSVYLDGQRNIYVADTSNHRIRKYSPENSDKGETMLDETSNINYPRCLFIDQESNYLFFLDQDNQGNYRVQILQFNSNPLKSTILLQGNQTKSYGMSLDQDFNIYISEYNYHRIVKWLSPNYEQYLIIVNNDKNQLIYPRSIYIDQSTNNLYVADKNRIQCWFKNSNQFEIVMQGGSVCPNGIEFDCHGNLYISQDRTIRIINQNTGLSGIDIIEIQSYYQWDSYFRKNDDSSHPEGIYLDRTNGDLYIVDSSFNLIEKFTIEN